MIENAKADEVDMPVKNSSTKIYKSKTNINFNYINNIKDKKNNNNKLNNKKTKSIDAKRRKPKRVTLLNEFFPSILKNDKNQKENEKPDEKTTDEKTITSTAGKMTINKKNKNKNTFQSFIDKKEIVFSNERWGDPFVQHKDDRTIRIFYQNINSIQCKSMDKWEDILNTIKRYKIDISGMSETCTNWSKPLLRNRFIAKARSIHPHSTIEFSNNAYKCKDDFLPGGTLQITTGDWHCRIIKSINDPQNMGRWSGNIYRLNELSSMYVISAYRVCKQSFSCKDETSKSSTAYTQQHVMLRDRSDNPYSVPKPRLQFIEDLKSMINQFRLRKTDHLIIMLDANEQLGDEKDGISSLMSEFSLIDTIYSHHKGGIEINSPHIEEHQMNEIECNIASYNRGSKRIDYILSTKSSLPFIKKSGYLPFFEGFQSDHRGMFIDLDSSLFDSTIDLFLLPTRHIGTDSKRKIKEKYISYINNEFIHSNIYKSIEALDTKDISTEENQNILFDLDKNIIDIMIKAEENCTIKQSKWSGNKNIHIARLVVKYWSIIFRGYKTNRDTSRQSNAIIKRCPLEITSQFESVPKNQSYFCFQNAKQNLKKLKLEHKVFLETNIINELEVDALEVGSKTERLLKNKNQRSNIKRTFNELKIILKSTKRSGISHIEVPHTDKNGVETNNPDEAKSWKIINDPKIIEDYIIDRNIKHFGQAQGSPFTQGKLADTLLYSATSPTCNEILNGLVNIDNLQIEDQYAKMIIEKLADKSNLDMLDSNISIEEMKKGFQKWDEKTSTSPYSKRHLGHIKVIVQIPKPKSEKKRKKYESEENEEKLKHMTDINFMKEDIFKVIHYIANTAFKNGISLPRWKNVTTAMIEKIPGQPKINKLRVIHLYECDYNMMLKILWARKLVWHAHDSKKLNSGQSGSRPGHRAVEVGLKKLKKEMTYLYSRLSRTGLATMDNDAKSCYDRIICNIAMLASRYYGMPENACNTHKEIH